MFRKSLLATFVVSLTMAVPASAATTQIGGLQSPDTAGTCPGSSMGTYTMAGSLVGCWYTDTFIYKANPSGTIQASGTEHFVGCLNGSTCGTFYTTFTLTAKYAPTLAEIHGRCHHPIVTGTDGFAAATGVLDFKDDVTTGNSTYRGHIKT
jgi:hypothetical protein